MDRQSENNKRHELSTQVFMSNCKLVNIADILDTQNINKYFNRI